MSEIETGQEKIKRFAQRAIDAAQAQPKRRPYNASASLSEYGIFPECDAAHAGSEGVMSIKLTDDGKAAVNHDVFWIPVAEVQPPRGAKLLLINEKYGTAVLGPYSPNQGWTHWQALPKFRRA